MADSIVIVGAGETGARAALALRQKGFTGRLTLIGAEPSPPYERPPVSKAVLAGEAEAPPVVVLDKDLAAKEIDYLAGTQVEAIDRNAHEVRTGDGQTVAYDKLLLATGARARPLALGDNRPCLLLRSREDGFALREKLKPGVRLVVIGGGFIGLEVASSAVARGADVTVVEQASQLMGRAVPASIAAIMQRRHEASGVKVLLEQDVRELDALDDADIVVAGIGAIPETELAQSAGLEIDNGISVDGRLSTSDPDIFAAGDCCSYPHPLFGDARIRLESWRNALDQAEHVAGSILGDASPYETVPWFWSDQHGLSLQIAGLPQFAKATVQRVLGDGSLIEFGLAEDGRLVSASGVAEGNKIAKDIRASEMMIGGKMSPKPSDLADPNVSLKSLLRR